MITWCRSGRWNEMLSEQMSWEDGDAIYSWDEVAKVIDRWVEKMGPGRWWGCSIDDVGWLTVIAITVIVIIKVQRMMSTTTAGGRTVIILFI